MDVAVGAAGTPVSKQASRNAQAFAVRERVRSVRVAQIVNTHRRHARRFTDGVPFPGHIGWFTAGRREYPGAIGTAWSCSQDSTSMRREPDRTWTGLQIEQHRTVAVNVLPLEPQRLGLARARVEQEAPRGNGHRIIRFRAVERPTEHRELVVREVVRLEASLSQVTDPLSGCDSCGRAGAWWA